MARASTPTLLSLDRFASILGIVPAHFNQGVSAQVFPFTSSCSQVWFQYAWQAVDRVSREDIALEIAIAERQIADHLKWWPAPTWVAQEVHKNPRYHRPDLYGIGNTNVRGQNKSITTNYSKVIAPGVRALAELPQAALAFSDEDGDGFSETATVTVATTLTDPCEVKVYFDGYSGAPEWEVRPARTKVIAGGTFTATFWAWQFISPAFWEEIPTVTDFPAVNLDLAVYEATVDVYQEYNDPTATSAVFYWEPQPSSTIMCSLCAGVGCSACTLTEQNGCMHIRDAERGVVVPGPGTYTDGAWAGSCYSVCRDPDEIKMYYYSGNLDERYLRGDTCQPLSDWWAQTIAALATARVERPFCACGNSTVLAEHWRHDLALSGGSRDDGRRAVSFNMIDNPFGTRRGEVMAWQRIQHSPERRSGAMAL